MRRGIQIQMQILLQRLGSQANWLALSKICEAFISKVTLVFSFTTCVLGNFESILNILGAGHWRFQMLFLGAVLFLIGHVWVRTRVPEELRGALSLDAVVSRMIRLSNFDFFSERRRMTEALITRISKRKPFDMPEGPLQFAQGQVSVTKNLRTWDEREAAALYHADLVLRQYDRPKERLIGLILLIGGITLLFIPTVLSFMRVVHNFAQ